MIQSEYFRMGFVLGAVLLLAEVIRPAQLPVAEDPLDNVDISKPAVFWHHWSPRRLRPW
ncbi:MAG: hypothetical protein Q7J98_08700 [Kiritimatiellia bacterium]|nr:hypothetical protein [Kiritimatiellia bacterium]